MSIDSTKKTLIICINIICFIGLVNCKIVKADCQGCCSHHGGVVCRNGITKCADGTLLSAICRNKGCDVCDSEDTITIIILDQNQPDKNPPEEDQNNPIQIQTDQNQPVNTLSIDSVKDKTGCFIEFLPNALKR